MGRFFGFFLMLLLIASHSSATVFNVADGDVAALKAAIAASNTNGEDDTIELATNGHYVLTVADSYSDGWNGLPDVLADGGKAVTIAGNGATLQRSSDSSTGNFRFLYVDLGSNLTLSSVTFTNGAIGEAGVYHFGGALRAYDATVTILNCAFIGNSSTAPFSSGDAGAIYNKSYSIEARLTIRNTIFSGNIAVGSGGAILNDGDFGTAVLTLSDCVFDNNSSDKGGAICNEIISSGAGNATVEATRCTFSSNSAFGGAAIASDSYGLGAHLNVSNSSFSHNTASGGVGGAIYNRGQSDVTLGGCSFASNSAGQSGGAIYNTGFGNIAITNCTLSGNSADQGGGIFTDSFNPNVKILNTTCSQNVANSACSIFNNNNSGTTVLVGNCILKQSATGGNTVGNFLSQGHNILNSSGNGQFTALGDRINTDPKLDPNGWQDNGGLTKTIALQANSPAIDAGNDALATRRDQRGYFRTGKSDIGAFEYNGGLVGTSSIARSGNNAVVSAEVVFGKT